VVGYAFAPWKSKAPRTFLLRQVSDADLIPFSETYRALTIQRAFTFTRMVESKAVTVPSRFTQKDAAAPAETGFGRIGDTG
jgi:hypothetical protein